MDTQTAMSRIYRVGDSIFMDAHTDESQDQFKEAVKLADTELKSKGYVLDNLTDLKARWEINYDDGKERWPTDRLREYQPGDLSRWHIG